mmetsp:Transcript_36094/g.111234  ORF Transcript_36094/g.111234 Transcript_36094/m.111234 type:complete len:250 (-) Transcript_36094:21-770(-)
MSPLRTVTFPRALYAFASASPSPADFAASTALSYSAVASSKRCAATAASPCCMYARTRCDAARCFASASPLTSARRARVSWCAVASSRRPSRSMSSAMFSSASPSSVRSSESAAAASDAWCWRTASAVSPCCSKYCASSPRSRRTSRKSPRRRAISATTSRSWTHGRASSGIANVVRASSSTRTGGRCDRVKVCTKASTQPFMRASTHTSNLTLVLTPLAPRRVDAAAFRAEPAKCEDPASVAGGIAHQ